MATTRKLSRAARRAAGAVRRDRIAARAVKSSAGAAAILATSSRKRTA